ASRVHAFTNKYPRGHGRFSAFYAAWPTGVAKGTAATTASCARVVNCGSVRSVSRLRGDGNGALECAFQSSAAKASASAASDNAPSSVSAAATIPGTSGNDTP